MGPNENIQEQQNFNNFNQNYKLAMQNRYQSQPISQNFQQNLHVSSDSGQESQEKGYKNYSYGNKSYGNGFQPVYKSHNNNYNNSNGQNQRNFRRRSPQSINKTGYYNKNHSLASINLLKNLSDSADHTILPQSPIVNQNGSINGNTNNSNNKSGFFSRPRSRNNSSRMDNNNSNFTTDYSESSDYCGGGSSSDFYFDKGHNFPIPQAVSNNNQVLYENDYGQTSSEPASTKIKGDKKLDNSPCHLLASRWTMYYRVNRSKNFDWHSCETTSISTVYSIESFWQLINHLCPPTRMKKRIGPNLMFFRENIQPQWEDEKNQNGGMWCIILKNPKQRYQIIDKLWYESLLACIGETLTFGEHINGVVIQRRQKEDRIQLWTKNADNLDIQYSIGQHYKSLLSLPEDIEICYTKHNDMKEIYNLGVQSQNYMASTPRNQFHNNDNNNQFDRHDESYSNRIQRLDRLKL